MKQLLLLIFCLYFIFFANAKNETFKVHVSTSTTYIIPVFSETSKFEDFNETMNFVAYLNDFYCQSIFCLFISLDEQYCEDYQLQDETILESVWNKTQSNIGGEIQKLNIAAKNATTSFSNCQYSTSCGTQRLNLIFITDIYDFSKFTSNEDFTEFQNIFYFAILSVNKECIQPKEESRIVCYNVFKDIPSDSVSDIIFDETIYYTLDPATIPYNYFLVMKEAEILTMTLLPQYLQLNREHFYNAPILFVASIQRNESYFYETVTVITDITDSNTVGESIGSYVYSESSTLSTKMIEKYLTEIYEADTFKAGTDQWSIVITDRFPHFIKDTNLTFNSLSKHLDIYFCSNNKTNSTNLFNENLSKHMYDILINDGNSSNRLNHITLFDTIDDLNFLHPYFPTGKNKMPSKNFDFHTHQTKVWIWILVSSGVFIFIIICALISFTFWRRRMHKKLAEKYFWAVQAGYTSKEAEQIVESGKELFIDESFVEIDYETIQGKGSSAIVYSGLLNTESPVSLIKPSIETRGFRNCKVAIKVVSKFGRDDYEQIFREVEAGIKLGWHRHICCLLGWSIKQSAPILIYEFIEGGDLYSWVKMKGNNNEEIEEKQIAQILWQISDGMEYIASVGLVHKDLAARNIMLTNSMVAKITDFGLASSCDESFTYQAPVQRRLPIRWMAPETMTDRLFSEASDVWSFSVLAWEVFSNCEIPYGNIDGNDILEYLNAGKRLELPEGLSNKWKEFIRKCWRLEMKERPNFKVIKSQLSEFLETFTQSYGYITAINDKNIL